MGVGAVGVPVGGVARNDGDIVLSVVVRRDFWDAGTGIGCVVPVLAGTAVVGARARCMDICMDSFLGVPSGLSQDEIALEEDGGDELSVRDERGDCVTFFGCVAEGRWRDTSLCRETWAFQMASALSMSDDITFTTMGVSSAM